MTNVPYALLVLAALTLLRCDRIPDRPASEEVASSASPRLATSASALPSGTTTVIPPIAAPPAAGESWNSTRIDWQPFEAGLLRARDQNKPICLVIYTTWCPHCRNYSHVFDDPRVVKRAHDFVMIRLDGDAQSDLASKYKPDGGYIPRTLFLGPDGELDTTLRLARARFQYFYDEHDASSLLGGMENAFHKVVH